MKITVTVLNNNTQSEYDFQIDNKQKVKTTLRVIKENMPEVLQTLAEPYDIKSYRNKKQIETEKTYEELKIYTGDKLIISGGQNNDR